MTPEVLISILVFAGTVLMFLGIAAYAVESKGRRTIIEKIRHSGGAQKPKATGNDLTSKAAASDIKKHILRIVNSLGERIKPTKQEETLLMQKKFLQAGIRAPNAIVLFFGAKAGCAITLVCVFLFSKILLLKQLPPIYAMFFAVILALSGFYLPDMWLRVRSTNRKEDISRGFPDALDLLVVCVEAGMGLDAAINRVAEELNLNHKELSEELRLLNLEVRAGKERRSALQNFALRTGLEDVANLVTLLIQTDKFGTSVAQALRVHSDSMRTARYQRAEEMASKLPVKLLFPLILFVFPSLFVVILGPALIRAFRLWSGH